MSNYVSEADVGAVEGLLRDLPGITSILSERSVGNRVVVRQCWVHLLHALHDLGQERAVLGQARGEAAATVAEDEGADAVRACGVGERVVGDLGIDVRVDVDPCTPTSARGTPRSVRSASGSAGHAVGRERLDAQHGATTLPCASTSVAPLVARLAPISVITPPLIATAWAARAG